MTVQPRIREATEGDLPGIQTLYRELRPHDPALAPETARAAFGVLLERQDLHLFVCELGGALVASCMLVCVPNLASGARPFGLIEHVITLSSHRKRGLARLVLEHALAKAWLEGCYKVMLLSGAQRAEAHRLYESLGFVGDVERGFVLKRRQDAQ